METTLEKGDAELLLSKAGAARRIGVSTATIRKMIKNGLPTIKLPELSREKIKLGDLQKYLKETQT